MYTRLDSVRKNLVVCLLLFFELVCYIDDMELKFYSTIVFTALLDFVMWFLAPMNFGPASATASNHDGCQTLVCTTFMTKKYYT
jgi:hypothetical protein